MANSVRYCAKVLSKNRLGNLTVIPVFCVPEQIKPQHIVGDDSLDNDDDPRKGDLHLTLTTSLCAVLFLLSCD